MLYISPSLETPLGNIFLAAEDDKLVGLWFEGQKYFCEAIRGSHAQICDDLSIFIHIQDWLRRYFAGEAPSADELEIALMGSEFRREIWRLLSGIPYGQTVTYGHLAAQYAKEKQLTRFSAQAVGGAVAHNPISIIIPCHRVLGQGGSLTGYAGGIERKKRLLDLEGASYKE